MWGKHAQKEYIYSNQREAIKVSTYMVIRCNYFLIERIIKGLLQLLSTQLGIPSNRLDWASLLQLRWLHEALLLWLGNYSDH